MLHMALGGSRPQNIVGCRTIFLFLSFECVNDLTIAMTYAQLETDPERGRSPNTGVCVCVCVFLRSVRVPFPTRIHDLLGDSPSYLLSKSCSVTFEQNCNPRVVFQDFS